MAFLWDPENGFDWLCRCRWEHGQGSACYLWVCLFDSLWCCFLERQTAGNHCPVNYWGRICRHHPCCEGSLVASCPTFPNLLSSTQPLFSWTTNLQSKHINIHFNFIWYIVEGGSIRLVYCPTDDRIADTLTKALPSTKAKHFASQFGLSSPWGGVLESSKVPRYYFRLATFLV